MPAHGALQFEALGAVEAGRGRAVRPGDGEDRAANERLVRTSGEQDPEHAHPDIDRIDLVHPVGVPASLIARGQVGGAGVPQVAVHPRGIPFGQQQRPRGGIAQVVRPEFLFGAEQQPQHEVGGEVAVHRPPEFRGPARRGDEGPHRDAEVVLRVGIAVAVPETAPVVGPDVRDAVFRAPDLGPVTRPRRRRLRGRWFRRGRRYRRRAAVRATDQAGKRKGRHHPHYVSDRTGGSKPWLPQWKGGCATCAVAI